MAMAVLSQRTAYSTPISSNGRYHFVQDSVPTKQVVVEIPVFTRKRPPPDSACTDVTKRPCLSPTAPKLDTCDSPVRQFICQHKDCGRTFKKASKLARHALSHTNERPFVCSFPECGKRYVRSEHLARHALVHASALEERRPFRCDYDGCEKAFASQYHMNRHTKVHTTPRPFQCTHDGCQESFAKHTQLRKHICAHVGKKPYPCDAPDCDKSFPTNQKLKQHRLVHSSEPRYSCGHIDCTQTFNKWTQLRAHIKAEHKICCYVCRKTFARTDVLKDHLRTHDVEREMFPCYWEGCGKAFTSDKIKEVHIRTAHQQLKPFQCEHTGCKALFAHKHLLVRHHRTHEGPVQRKQRKDRIPRPDVLQLLTGHDYASSDTGRRLACTIEGCLYKFRREYDLRRHLQSLHDVTSPVPAAGASDEI
ncbi:hypothetical protein HDU85_002270 [Gaertneriomyces sp. JEL0708]|nr:hypothetical protein HDU85_002270 [Gaertneriomyces sp. JEL0708]